MKLVLAYADWCRLVRFLKVPAHLNLETVQGEAREDALGNGAADEEAKRARGLHPQPSPAQEQELAAQLRRARLVVRTIAATLPHFPPITRERMQRRPIARDGAVIHGRGGHVWVHKAGVWRCSTCWALSIKPDITADMAHRACPGPKQSLVAEEITRRGHKLAFAEGSLPILFCWDCGAFSSQGLRAGNQVPWDPHAGGGSGHRQNQERRAAVADPP